MFRLFGIHLKKPQKNDDRFPSLSTWVEVYLPKLVGLDPTNNKVVNEQYIRIAIGRDYDDVAPIRGTFYGGGKRRTMQVIVDVKRIAE